MSVNAGARPNWLSLIAVVAVALAAAPAARAADPPLGVPAARLAAALSCPTRPDRSAREPVLLVHGTGLTADESWAWNYEKSLPLLGWRYCAVTLPEHALGDIQIASEYVVYAIRRMAALSHRRPSNGKGKAPAARDPEDLPRLSRWTRAGGRGARRPQGAPELRRAARAEGMD